MKKSNLKSSVNSVVENSSVIAPEVAEVAEVAEAPEAPEAPEVAEVAEAPEASELLEAMKGIRDKISINLKASRGAKAPEVKQKLSSELLELQNKLREENEKLETLYPEFKEIRERNEARIQAEATAKKTQEKKAKAHELVKAQTKAQQVNENSSEAPEVENACLINDKIENELNKCNKVSKYYDLRTVKKLNKKQTPIESVFYTYLKNRANKFNNRKLYTLQVRDVLTDTSHIFVKNKASKTYTVLNTCTTETMARVVKTLAYEKICYLQLIALKGDKNNFLIQKCANSLEEFEKFYGIEHKEKKEKGKAPEVDGNGDGDGLDVKTVSNMTKAELVKALTIIMKSNEESTSKLSRIDHILELDTKKKK